jgi:hypothetical protein
MCVITLLTHSQVATARCGNALRYRDESYQELLAAYEQLKSERDVFKSENTMSRDEVTA